MKKLHLLAIATFIILALLLSACARREEPVTQDPVVEDPVVEEPEEPAEPATEPVVIRWATWENIYMAEEMAAKFNERNPDIKVVIDDFGGWFGNDQLIQRAASGTMPDVFQPQNPDVPLQNGWLLDMKPFIDEETELKFYDLFVETGTFDDMVIMLPTYIFVHGVVLNKTLLETYNLPIPDYNWTLEEFRNILVSTTRGSTVGIWGIEDAMKHIPAQMNDDLGWGTWDGSRYVFDDEWIYAVNWVKDLRANKVSMTQYEEGLQNPWDLPEGAERDAAFEAINQMYMDTFGVESSFEMYMKGHLASWFDFSWALGFDQDPAFGGFEWDFYPFPAMNEGDVSRPGIVSDSLAISANTENPEAAFRFVRYLSYDPQAYDDRIEIVENYSKEAALEKYPHITQDRLWDTLSFNHIPAVNDQSVRDRWADYNNVKPGVRFILNNLHTGYVDGFKFVPDFDRVYHHTVEKAVREQFFTGQKTAADLADELERIANDMTQEAIKSMRR